MPTKKYLVETDQGKFLVEVDEPAPPANLQAQGGDTINGRDPNAAPGFLERLNTSLQSLAHPQSLSDLAGLAIPSSEGLAAKAASKIGPMVESAGRGLSAAGEAFKPASKYAAIGDLIYHRGNVAEGAAIAAAPYAADVAGRGLQRAGQFLQRETPVLKFEAPAVNIARQAAPVEAAAPIAEAVTKTAKPILNALESKEYVRLLKTGMSGKDALQLIQQQRDLINRLGLPTDKAVKIEQDYIAAHGRRQQ